MKRITTCLALNEQKLKNLHTTRTIHDKISLADIYSEEWLDGINLSGSQVKQKIYYTGIMVMQVLKLFLFLFISILIAGCAASSGPIKGYNENSAIDKDALSTIYLPPEIEFLEVDGMGMKTPFIEEGYNEVHIPAGEHQVALKYVAYWGDSSSGSMVNSKPIVLGLNLAPKSSYYIRFKQPKDQWDAQHLAANFSPWLEDAAGKKIKIVNNLSGGRLLTSGATSMTGQQIGKGSLQKLKFWWRNASYKDKKAFEKWMGNN